ncbi:hypothetical protein DRX19_25350 [Salmonella enterica subsp. enterica]|uniref:Uncharacterized protein n=1 Tax=Salmonella enterica subsp. enterica serovar Pensacola TaxID=34042 RepID=A0A602Z592_SALET|nr:hypothetical protein [Salmonella enterica subsp. enterica serovar Pensacola]EAV2403481.1 hypothetical protein [Salmonella enterica]EBO9451435.1 hypothetical protein [Salmonella enterica]EBT4615319.1 hypothetical protein [Salmonella enterica]ECT8498447.1 hypothetical protein [Salmonella enterica subsp. enterica serovar Pensacola]
MTYQYIELVVKTTTAKSNINAAINILKELNLNPEKMRKMKLDYLQTTVFFLNQEGEKIGFIQGNVNDEKPALLTLYC